MSESPHRIDPEVPPEVDGSPRSQPINPVLPSESGVPSDRLYSLYLDEAEKYDSALATRLKTGSDVLLIYAGLFSAIVAALLIESYSNLIPDQGEATVFYLAQIAQHLASTSSGNITAISFTPYPDFQSPSSAVRVNILWVLSLIVSLACALGATLVQTWTNRYTRLLGQYTNVVHRAQQREFYFEGIKNSHLLAVAEAMPALLHLALFLFLAGLVEFFFQTHIVVAYVTLAAVVVVSTAYGALTLMPLVITSTPYQTPLSLRLPRTFEPLKLRLQRRPWMKQQRDRPFQYAEAMEKISALRQSRALQWLLDRMRGAESFDRFVEGIEPFLGAAEQSTRIVFQLNVNTDPEGRRRCLSAHIGHRLHLCLDTSIAIDTRRSQVKSMAGALWSLLIRVHAGDMDNDIAPGGTDDTSEWRPVSQHLQQWLHPYILRSLRRLRQDPDPFISLYSICTSIVILVHTARLLATAMLQKGDITVPHGWGFIQLLEAYDSGVTYEAVEMSFELDVLVECLLGPPRDEMGQRSRAEENLSRFSNARGFVPKSSFDFSALGSSPSKDVEHLDTKAVSNSCHLAALCAFLEHLTTKTRDLHPTPTVIDLIQRTFRLLAVNTSAENSDRTIQRSFNTNLERVFHSHYYADPRAEILGGRATFLHEEIRGITALISKTLDHPVWSRNAGIVAFGITSYVRADELVLLDSGSGRMGDVVFDGKPLIPSAEYTICTADRYDGLDLSGSDNTSVLIFALHGGHNQKWQLLQNGQYWSLRNAQTGTFLGIESDLGSICDSTAVCASNEAIAWDIRIEPDTSQYCLYYAGTEYAIARGSDNKAVLSTNEHVHWEFGRVVFKPLVKQDVNYFLICGGTSNTLDLSGVDYTSILIFPLHGGSNQKWKMYASGDGDYWYIQSIANGAFLSIDGVPRDGAVTFASRRTKCAWEIRPDEAYTMTYNLFYAGTSYALVQNTSNKGEVAVLSRSPSAIRLRFDLIECDAILAKPEPRPSRTVGNAWNSGIGAVTPKSGSKYLLYCHDSDDVLDLSAADNTTVMLWTFNGGTNQKWLLKQEGERWTIKCLVTDQYLCIEGPPVDDAVVLVSNTVAYWEIRPVLDPLLPQSADAGPILDTVHKSSGPHYNICYAGTHLSLAVGAHEVHELGAVVSLSGANKASIKWRLEMLQ